jgi:asparagine synthetase B (glutamine-hydrolysing)
MGADVETVEPPNQMQVWYRLRPFELATGLVLGSVPPAPHDATRPQRPREVLERLLTEALRRPPCVVAFSGGRDSSAVLALAVGLARRDGLALPIPVTRRFPDEPDTDESDWQTTVIRHLGVQDWVRLPLRGACDLIGPIARPILRDHGLLWPPTVHVNVPLLEVAAGGTLLTGEGGDEVFGPHRGTPVLHLLRGGRRRRRGALRHLVGSIGPPAMRRRHWRRHVAAVGRDWLRPHVQSALIEQIASEYVREPLSWRVATGRAACGRGWVLGAATMQRLADERDVRMRHPLLDPAFLRALAASGPMLGPMSRAEAMRRLFGDVLPPAVLRRRSKAYFNTALLGEASRAFAEGWRGGGVDTRLVDEERLRREWLRPVPHAGSFALLQAAWMAARGWPLDGRR